MSQLDISIFYSHLFGLLLMLYIFSNFSILVLCNYFYNIKIRNIDLGESLTKENKLNNINILYKVLD